MADIGRVGIVGGSGWLGSAIAKALIGSDTVPAERLTCSYRTRKPDSGLGVSWTQDNQKLAENSDVVILSVRPDDWSGIDISAPGKLVISVMAGISVDSIKRKTGSVRIARALPNAAAEVGQSYTPFFLASSNPNDRGTVEALFRSCGMVDSVFREEHIDYFTAMTGSGEAFPAFLAEAMMNDAIARGLPMEIALRAAQQVIIDAGRLQEYHRASPADTVKSFVDYDGTTSAGIVAMRENGFESVIRSGLDAAFRKAQALTIKQVGGHDR
ncbi:pyrroline-5-carboxylate reductase family protein [Rhizobium mayense]|uniref:Pyrroline-5-carboxylate reductase n=1 Tax=Rhizobium mayense TaxID=1312184 RepID=A0ABT7JRJ0_9HYPH|nr:pyrroline-5-carboxylate reductase dimerization domain-containing protein [Rhizobium mayense]MDL2398970.1 pyrroline-5-carboxylate reductase dimerization domain-containing protein [Rhizobium mayense]